MLRAFRFALLILGVLSQFGCSTITVEVESTRRSDLVGISDVGTVYQLLPSWVDKSDNKYDKFASQVEYVLNGLGYVPVSETGQDNPELLIYLSYGIIVSKKEEIKYQSHNYSARLCTSCSPVACYCGAMGGTMQYNDVGIRTTYRNVYRSFLQLTANYVGSNTQQQPAWSTKATSSGRSNDLNSLFPFLLVASEAYIGTKARDKVKIRLTDAKHPLLD